jgi:hypothetical protein
MGHRPDGVLVLPSGERIAVQAEPHAEAAALCSSRRSSARHSTAVATGGFTTEAIGYSASRGSAGAPGSGVTPPRPPVTRPGALRR